MKMSDNVCSMDVLPYPEFKELSVHLTEVIVGTGSRHDIEGCVDESCTQCGDQKKYGSSEVSGYVVLVMNEGMRNAVKNIVIECAADFVVTPKLAVGNTSETVHPLWSEKQQNACDFSDLPGGTYDIPFSFTLPQNLPQSLELNSRHVSKGCMFKGTVEYNIKVTVINRSDDEDFKRLCFQHFAPFTRVFNKLNEYCTPPSVEGLPFNETFNFTKNKVKSMVSFPNGDFAINKGSLNLSLKLENQSSKVVKGVSTSLHQKLFTKNPETGITENQKYCVGQYKSDNAIPAKKVGCIGISFDLTVPYTGCATRAMTEVEKCAEENDINALKAVLCPTSYIESSYGIVNISYVVAITLKMKFGSDISFEVPVFISDYYGEEQEIDLFSKSSISGRHSIYSLDCSTGSGSVTSDDESDIDLAEEFVQVNTCENTRDSKDEVKPRIYRQKRARSRANSTKRALPSLRRSLFQSAFEMPPSYKDLGMASGSCTSDVVLPVYDEALQMKVL
eukprot:Nk52_evm34s223 gene=Nk52_evmTU34s223